MSVGHATVYLPTRKGVHVDEDLYDDNYLGYSDEDEAYDEADWLRLSVEDSFHLDSYAEDLGDEWTFEEGIW